jgi:hypothetical protein
MSVGDSRHQPSLASSRPPTHSPPSAHLVHCGALVFAPNNAS